MSHSGAGGGVWGGVWGRGRPVRVWMGGLVVHAEARSLWVNRAK